MLAKSITEDKILASWARYSHSCAQSGARDIDRIETPSSDHPGTMPPPASIDECFVCKNTIQKEDRAHVNCGHSFCKGCLLSWEATGSRACPQCRTPRKYLKSKGTSKQATHDVLVRLASYSVSIIND
ncbi:hypothetical protein B484DRAFT_443518 [Ochromonadaceae sp. CCMP2298]|nr:hypothetical protein B484DRAFT_443518 [Ochromonadaceae sp. CCMP2298]